MKVIYTSTAIGRSVAIIDDHNVAHGKLVERKQEGGEIKKILEDPKYFLTVGQCVRDIVRLEANELCTDLKSWLTEYKVATKRLELVLGTEV